MLSGKNQIGNQLTAEGQVSFKTFNPLQNKENPTVFTEATTDEIDKALQLAEEAFLEYAQIDGEKKATFLNAIADEILNLGDDLIATYCQETGLLEGRANGERGRTVGQLRAFANLVLEGSWVEASIDTAQPDRTPMPKPDLRKMLVPLGPVVVFGASNFPLAYSTAGGDTAAALAAGCPVVVKSHPMHAGTGELISNAIIKAAEKTGMPNGVFSNINSQGTMVGKLLVEHPKVKAVGFTGSIAGGRALYNMAAQRKEPIPVFAEMGSVNPVVLLPNKLATEAQLLAQTYAGSITLGAGQFCTNPGLILGIKSDALNQFVDELAKEIVKIDPSCMLHPNIISAFRRKKDDALKQDGTTLVGDYADGVEYNYARQAIATVDGKTFLNNQVLQEEVFGPFSLVVQCDTPEELEQIIWQLDGQLTGTVMAKDEEINDFRKVIDALQNRVGRIIFNGVPTGVEVCPSMVHGGPYPASTDSRFTAVGVHSIKRWVRPFSYQNWPNTLLPDALKNENPLGISREVNGEMTDSII